MTTAPLGEFQDDDDLFSMPEVAVATNRPKPQRSSNTQNKSNNMKTLKSYHDEEDEDLLEGWWVQNSPIRLFTELSPRMSTTVLI